MPTSRCTSSVPAASGPAVVLSDVVAAVAARLEIRAAIVPMSDEAVRTRVTTAAGELAFQEYFVRERCAPSVTAVTFAGAERARAERARAGGAQRCGRRGHHHLPVQPLSEHRPDPGGARLS